MYMYMTVHVLVLQINLKSNAGMYFMTILITPLLIDRWFCHVDDDNYLNTDQLVKLLQTYNHTQHWYLGKPSLSHPLEIQSRSNEGVGTGPGRAGGQRSGWRNGSLGIFG